MSLQWLPGLDTPGWLPLASVEYGDLIAGAIRGEDVDVGGGASGLGQPLLVQGMAALQAFWSPATQIPVAS